MSQNNVTHTIPLAQSSIHNFKCSKLRLWGYRICYDDYRSWDHTHSHFSDHRTLRFDHRIMKAPEIIITGSQKIVDHTHGIMDFYDLLNMDHKIIKKGYDPMIWIMIHGS